MYYISRHKQLLMLGSSFILTFLIASGEFRHAFAQNPNPVRSIIWSNDGTKIGIGYQSGIVEIVDSVTGSVQQNLQAHSNETDVNELAWSPDDSLFASANNQGNVVVWTTEDWNEVANLSDVKGGVDLLSWNIDGSILTAFAFNTVAWDSDNNFAVIAISNGGNRVGIAWFPNKEQVIMVGVGGIIFVDPVDFSVQDDIFINQVNSIAINPNGDQFLSGSLFGRITLWDAATHQEIAVLQSDIEASRLDVTETNILDVAFSEDGQSIAAIQGDGSFTQWDAATGELLEKTDISDELIYVAAFSPDGSQLAIPSQNGASIKIEPVPVVNWGSQPVTTTSTPTLVQTVTSTPVPPSLEPSPNQEKGNASILGLLGGVAIVIAGLGGWYLYKRSA